MPHISFLFYFGKIKEILSCLIVNFGFCERNQSNSFSKSKICQGVVGFIDLRQILQSFGSDSEISSHTSVWLYPH